MRPGGRPGGGSGTGGDNGGVGLGGGGEPIFPVPGGDGGGDFGSEPDFGTPGQIPTGGGGGAGGLRPPFGDSDQVVDGDRFPSGPPGDDDDYDDQGGFIDDIYGEDEDAFEDTFGSRPDPGTTGSRPTGAGGGGGGGGGGSGGSGASEISTTMPPFGVVIKPDHEDEGEGDDGGDDGGDGGGKYVILPGSLYDCPAPGFYPAAASCHEFYVCQEVLPGKLLADTVYRCPRRYLFDEVTRRCQRESRVTCSRFALGGGAGDDGLAGKEGPADPGDVLVVIERFIDDFFATPLTYDETRRRFGYAKRRRRRRRR